MPQNSRVFTGTGYLLPLIACLGALLALRLAAIYAAKTDLVFDEAQYWTWSRDLAFGYFSKPPMIAWLIRGATAICGDGEACIRSASPVLYTLASVVTFLTGRALFNERVGFWSAIVFDTLPGVSYSSLLITTDVPLILFWSIALYFWVMLVKRQSIGFAILLGVAIGLGLLAKQAMIYAVLCVACHALVSREAREALKGGRGIVAGLTALVLFAPNIVWNAEHGYPTVRHTSANIGWQYPYVHPLQLLEYLIVQIGVFGPILIAVLLRTAWREIREPHELEKDPAALFLSSRACDPDRAGDLVARARQLVGDRLSVRHDPRHRRHARARTEDSIPPLALPAPHRRRPSRHSPRFRAAMARIRAGSVPVASRRLAWRGRFSAYEAHRGPLWGAPGQFAGDGG